MFAYHSHTHKNAFNLKSKKIREKSMICGWVGYGQESSMGKGWIPWKWEKKAQQREKMVYVKTDRKPVVIF